MKLKTFLLGLLLVVCFNPLLVMASDEDENSGSAMEQLEEVEEHSTEAAKHAEEGDEESAREEAAEGWEGGESDE